MLYNVTKKNIVHYKLNQQRHRHPEAPTDRNLYQQRSASQRHGQKPVSAELTPLRHLNEQKLVSAELTPLRHLNEQKPVSAELTPRRHQDEQKPVSA
jgi:hypothetical protein